MKNRGYYLSFEAIVSLALLGLLISMPLQQEKTSLSDLHLLQKENDLLVLWAKRFDYIDIERMKQEFEFAFPEKKGEIIVDWQVIEIGKKGNKAVSSKAVFFNKNLERHEIRLVVFK